MSLFIYDENVNNFINSMKDELDRLSQVTGYWSVRNITVLVGDRIKEHGYYDHEQGCIVLNKKLVYMAKNEVAKKILGHEVAHHIARKRFGNIPSHGKEFHNICEEYNLFAPATADIEKMNETCSDEKGEIIVDKVKKLLRLASSDNENESKLATAKANQLLMKYNLSLNIKNTSQMYMARVVQYKRINPKISAISSILQQFNVYTVNCTRYDGRNKRIGTLQASGSRANVEIVQYVYKYLDKEFDRLWNIAKKEHNLSGLRDKNSYFTGLSRGFIAKMKESNEGVYTEEDQKALLVIKQDVKDASKKHVYSGSKLTNSYSSRYIDPFSSGAGQRDGRKISINQGIKGSQTGLLTR